MLTWRQEVHTAATIIDVIITIILGQMSFKTSEVYDLSVYFIGSHIEEAGKSWLCCIDMEWTHNHRSCGVLSVRWTCLCVYNFYIFIL